jgi:hypothetical protein
LPIGIQEGRASETDPKMPSQIIPARLASTIGPPKQ